MRYTSRENPEPTSLISFIQTCSLFSLWITCELRGKGHAVFSSHEHWRPHYEHIKDLQLEMPLTSLLYYIKHNSTRAQRGIPGPSAQIIVVDDSWVLKRRQPALKRAPDLAKGDTVRHSRPELLLGKVILYWEHNSILENCALHYSFKNKSTTLERLPVTLHLKFYAK